MDKASEVTKLCEWGVWDEVIYFVDTFTNLKNSMIFRQLFDEKTWTYTYILADSDTREAIIIDPVRDQVERDMRLITELGLTLKYILDTHIHADHITGSGLLREKTEAQIVMWMGASIAKPDILLADGEVLNLWNMEIQALATPGHTDGCTSYRVENMVFTGDALLIRKTGRTDFQWGSAKKLYHSIMTQIYTLPDETLIYPWHDYTGQTVSTVWEEKIHNTRITSDTSLADFIMTMQALHLPYPKYIDEALPANLQLGIV